jgi:hypothetical protein
LRSGSWKQVVDTELGASSSYLFTSALEMYDGMGDPIASNGSQVELQFYLFDSATNISLGDLNFDVLPSLAKFSIRLFSWPWASPSDSIEMRMKINPSFLNFTRQPNTPKAGVTTFVLEGPQSAAQNTKTQLRLVDTVEVDGVQVNSGGVQFDMDPTTSELVLSFGFFNSSLVYDPDLGVLFGTSGKGGSGGGGDNMGLIVAVAVVVPVAVAVVVTSAVVIVIVAHRKRKARMRRLTKTMQTMHQL